MTPKAISIVMKTYIELIMQKVEASSFELSDDYSKTADAIISAVIRELNRIFLQERFDHAVFALSTRNVFELRLLLNYVKNPDNLDRVLKDLVVDTYRVLDASTYLLRCATALEFPSISNSDGTKEKLDQFSSLAKQQKDNIHQKYSSTQNTRSIPPIEGYKNKPIGGSEMYEGVCTKEHYENVWQFLSKNVHPSPYSLLVSPNLPKEDKMRYPMFHCMVVVIEDFLDELSSTLERLSKEA